MKRERCCDQVTRNESVLAVRQCTAVNPHVLALVAARLHWADGDESDSDDDDDDDADGLDAEDMDGPAWSAPFSFLLWCSSYDALTYYGIHSVCAPSLWPACWARSALSAVP